MEKIDSLEMQGNEVEYLRREGRELDVKLEELTLREQIFWAQKVNVRWLKKGDVSSKFFHRAADGKRKKKFIKRLEVRPGVVVDSEEQIVQGISDFYSKLFSKDEIVRLGIEGIEWRPIDQESAIWLERSFEELEIKDAVFECERDKAPGLDGFSMRDEAIRIGDFRPISLVTSLYKILGKVLSKRLRASLGDTISSTQGAFMQGKGMMRDGGIKGCLASCNMSVIVNSKPGQTFKASRGLRQGDPLSHFLFIMVANVLGMMVERAKEVGLFEGLQVGRDKISVTHLQFADDTIFFFKGDESQIVNLCSVVRLFGVLFGLKVNLENSRVAGINVDSKSG
ncbi:uncharacterized protein LOC114286749 [Camellia sinensis]|uniref:uncharacterized protein LOC114286749 n=1 Tax=Camellia sinensis TaxID=4442 RepID=UPI0010357C4C|nr:uncharacterized protein LOC114286749 [Camellia sinensis]